MIRESSFAQLPFCKQLTLEDPLVYSVFLQPFILSPMINVGDIAVSWFREENVSMSLSMEHRLRLCIARAHPFPVIERWVAHEIRDPADCTRVLVPPQTQVFIPLDEMGAQFTHESAFAAWIPFGVGARGCAGESLAVEMIVSLFNTLQDSGRVISPKENHQYSGRHNDTNDAFSWEVVWYQLKLFVNICCQMMKKRMRLDTTYSSCLLKGGQM